MNLDSIQYKYSKLAPLI